MKQLTHHVPATRYATHNNKVRIKAVQSQGTRHERPTITT